jgi:hypothetical protein
MGKHTVPSLNEYTKQQTNTNNNKANKPFNDLVFNDFT